MTIEEKNAHQAALFFNRITKNYRRLKKWARRTGVFAYRLYDVDIPEIPLAVEVFVPTRETIPYLTVALYERPYARDEQEEARWVSTMVDSLSAATAVSRERIFLRIRKRQRGSQQYERCSNDGVECVVQEGAAFFSVNLSDYLDTGLFLDHRPLRLRVANEAARKRVLNLFCYTGSFSVHAQAGGAASVDSVDTSKRYLAWTARNLALNANPAGTVQTCIRRDVFDFLQDAVEKKRFWDMVICDAPSFSNSKRNAAVLDIRRDWAVLCSQCLRVLSKRGVLYFSTNARRFSFNPDELQGAAAKKIRCVNMSSASIPIDFRRQNIHQLWKVFFD